MVVIVFSSSNEPTDLSGSYALGPYSYLVKSPTPDQLEDLPRAFKLILAGIQSLQRDLAIFLAWQLSSCREEFLQLGGKTICSPHRRCAYLIERTECRSRCYSLGANSCLIKRPTREPLEAMAEAFNWIWLEFHR